MALALSWLALNWVGTKVVQRHHLCLWWHRGAGSSRRSQEPRGPCASPAQPTSLLRVSHRGRQGTAALTPGSPAEHALTPHVRFPITHHFSQVHHRKRSDPGRDLAARGSPRPAGWPRFCRSSSERPGGVTEARRKMRISTAKSFFLREGLFVTTG